MNTMSYSRQQLAERQQPLVLARQKALDADPDVQAARQSLEKAQESLAGLQNYIKGLPASQRLQYNGNVTESKAAIRSLEQAVRVAENQHVRRDYLSKLQEKRQQEQQQHTSRHEAMAEQAEAEAKIAYRSVYLQTEKPSEFEAAWPQRWEAIKRERAEALLAAQSEAAAQYYGL